MNLTHLSLFSGIGGLDLAAEWARIETVGQCECRELWGWCDCGKAIEGRWIGLANFCPWCGRVMEWKKDGDTN